MHLINPLLQVLTCLVYVLTVLSAYGGYIDPTKIATPSLVCLIMPYMVLITVLTILAWSIKRNLFYTLFGVMALIVCIPSMSHVLPLGYQRKSTPGAEKFKIISWNVLHTRDIRQPDYPGNRAVEYMVKSGADVICLTELWNYSPSELKNTPQELVDSLDRIYPYRKGKSSSDIKVISKYPVELLDIPEFDGREGRHRFELFKVDFPENHMLIVAMVHLYSFGLSKEERNVVTEINSISTAEKSMMEFKSSIMGKLKNAFRMRAGNAELLREVLNTIPEDIPLIVCGDFNDVPSSWAYNIVRGEDLRDAYTETNFGPAFTYNLHKFYFHIDQMLYRGDLRGLDLSVGKINTSDHYPLIGEFEFIPNKTVKIFE